MPVLDWIGKEKVINHHMEVPYRVLDEKYSYGADSENMIIHGDNLLALKSLLPQYEGRIKCIYIDPPYNTGNEGWVYNDNVNDPRIKKWLGEVVGAEGKDLSRHDKWLCMMYPRLKLLHRLLADDGAIFISIDDNEQANLRLICDEIFGKNNFIAQILVKRQGGRQDSKHYAVVHEYCICYARKSECFSAGMDIKEKSESVYPKYDKAKQRHYKTQLLRKWGANSLRENRPNLYYPIYYNESENCLSLCKLHNDDVEIYPLLSDGQQGRWRWGKSKMQQALKEGRVEFLKDKNNNWIPYEKIFAPDNEMNEYKKFTTWQDDTGNGSIIMKQIFGEPVFDYPKSTELLSRILNMADIHDNSIVLDSFAGSGTTAHAVLNMNKADGGNRKFILIEMCDYAETITAERVKRVIDGYGEEDKAVEGTGGGFKFYELGEKLLDGDYLNENADIDKIREYVYFTETKQHITNSEEEPYFLGAYLDTAYYFFYERDEVTTLDRTFLHKVKTKAESYVIYADRCILSDEELEKYHITFKKIPRDITRL